MEVTTFTCSICAEASCDICIYCTKDACSNHLCERCKRCSDCCACEMPVFNQERSGHAARDGHIPVVAPEIAEPVEVFAVSEHAFDPESQA